MPAVADSTDQPAVRRVSGTVSFRERIALPPGAVVTVELSDVSAADAAAAVLARTAVQVIGQVPVPFEPSVDAADVDEQASISVWARLRSEVGTWQSDAPYPVLTNGAPDVAEIIVRRVGGS
jgi:putative lipoprotein